MSFIVKKKIGGKDYFYLNENKRVDGKVKTKTLAYLGKTREEAEKKMKRLIEKKDINVEGRKLKREIEKEDSKETKLERKKISVEDMASFCKRKGIVFQSSEIYGGFAGFWDFGPLGAEIFNNLKQEFWRFFVQSRGDMVGIEASIVSHPKTWEASGHIASFGDLVLECSKCGNNLRADHFIEDTLGINADGMKADKINELILENNLKCPKCKSDFKEIKDFNLLFKTFVGAKEDTASVAYLRGETAQGMFMNFKNVIDSSRVKLPFGIAQIGRCFRNEIAPRDFLFRSREFNIGEFEFFLHPDMEKCDLLDKEHLNVKFRFLDAETQDKGSKDLKDTSIGEILKKGKLNEWHAYWLAEQLLFFKKIGLDLNNIKVREHVKTELSHYSSATFDMDYLFPFGSKEIAGNANRGQYDLNQHIKFSKAKLEIFDEESKKNVIPKVIEPTFGMERIFLSLITDAYYFDSKRDNVVLKLNPRIAPIKAAIFPIVKRDDMEKLSTEVFDSLKEEWNVLYDNSGSIGRRYARNDEVGTPFCITIDDDSLKNKDVTIRDRDTTKQVRVKISNLKETLRNLISGEKSFIDLK